MHYTVLAVGKVRPPFSDDIQHYQRLLARHARVRQIEVREDEQVERRIPERAYVSLLDAGGEEYTSEDFARWLEERRQAGRDVCFVVGEGRPDAADGDDRVAHALRYYGDAGGGTRTADQPPHRS